MWIHDCTPESKIGKNENLKKLKLKRILKSWINRSIKIWHRNVKEAVKRISCF